MPEFNERLLYCRRNKVIYFQPPEVGRIGDFNAYLEEGLSKVKLTYYAEGGVTTFITHLDDIEESKEVITGGTAFAILMRYYTIPRYLTLGSKKADFDIQVKFSASPYTFINERYNKRRLDVYYYDLNSAYAFIMLTYRFPDTSTPPIQKIVEKGEIGFDCDGNLVHPGAYGLYVFKEMESPLKVFASRWFCKKKNARSEQDKTKAKNVLCYSIGYLQLVNPFLRAFVVNSCNEYIQSLIDDDTIYCNTDCIVSLKERKDLKIGDDIGEWKWKRCKFAYIGYNYQINNDTPTWRGVPRGWWKAHPDFDILKDEPPHDQNIYRFDIKKFQYIRS